MDQKQTEKLRDLLQDFDTAVLFFSFVCFACFAGHLFFVFHGVR